MSGSEDESVELVVVDETTTPETGKHTITIDATKESYPWSALWTNLHNTEDLLQDHSDSTKSLQPLLNEQKIVIEDQKSIIHDLKKKQEQMSSVTLTTFNKMQEMILSSKHTIQELQLKLNEAQQDELEYIVLVQSILCHKTYKLKTIDQKQSITLKNVIKWLAQRQSVLQYLRQKQVLPDRADQIESILHVEQKQLSTLIKKCFINLQLEDK
jgi:hypothetical protein